jgi:hypothetical protein
LAFAEPLEPFDRLASAIGADVLDWNEPRDRTTVFGDRDLLASSDSLEQGRKVSLGLVDTNVRGPRGSDRCAFSAAPNIE